MRPEHYELLIEFVSWAGKQTYIDGVALLGLNARDEITEESEDLDFVIVSDKIDKTIDGIIKQFNIGQVEQITKQDRGNITSLRVEYSNGLEVGYGVVGTAWVKEPLEPASIDVVMQGFKVLWDEDHIFDRLIQAAEDKKWLT